VEVGRAASCQVCDDSCEGFIAAKRGITCVLKHGLERLKDGSASNVETETFLCFDILIDAFESSLASVTQAGQSVSGGNRYLVYATHN
jgi:hypothetical protein